MRRLHPLLLVAASLVGPYVVLAAAPMAVDVVERGRQGPMPMDADCVVSFQVAVVRQDEGTSPVERGILTLRLAAPPADGDMLVELAGQPLSAVSADGEAPRFELDLARADVREAVAYGDDPAVTLFLKKARSRSAGGTEVALVLEASYVDAPDTAPTTAPCRPATVRFTLAVQGGTPEYTTTFTRTIVPTETVAPAAMASATSAAPSTPPAVVAVPPVPTVEPTKEPPTPTPSPTTMMLRACPRATMARIAPAVLSRARSSSTWPRATSTVMTEAASK